MCTSILIAVVLQFASFSASLSAFLALILLGKWVSVPFQWEVAAMGVTRKEINRKIYGLLEQLTRAIKPMVRWE